MNKPELFKKTTFCSIPRNYDVACSFAHRQKGLISDYWLVKDTHTCYFNHRETEKKEERDNNSDNNNSNLTMHVLRVGPSVSLSSYCRTSDGASSPSTTNLQNKSYRFESIDLQFTSFNLQSDCPAFFPCGSSGPTLHSIILNLSACSSLSPASRFLWIYRLAVR